MENFFDLNVPLTRDEYEQLSDLAANAEIDITNYTHMILVMFLSGQLEPIVDEQRPILMDVDDEYMPPVLDPSKSLS